uniref:Uncharacterized protein n=1 Tax=Sphenodon punctatus TaxID=8508 RepID=A0A8D0GG49_SPHPU
MKLSISLPGMCHLKILHLQSNNIGSPVGPQLARALAECPHVEEISLSENSFGDSGVRVFSEELPRLTQLRKIELKLCEISDCSSKPLVLSMSCCPLIEEIILSWNSLGDESALQLAMVLPVMTRLRILDLDKNLITAHGASRLAESLAQSPGIQIVRLWKNQIPKNVEENLGKQDSRLHFSFF